jgi:hypothetical protein
VRIVLLTLSNAHVRLPSPPANLVRFAHNWNDGTMEYWNNGYGS